MSECFIILHNILPNISYFKTQIPGNGTVHGTAHFQTAHTSHTTKVSGCRSGINGSIWMFPKIGVPQNGWLIMENHIKMDDLGVPSFLETPIWRAG